MEKSKIAEWEVHGDFGVLTINNPPQNYLNDLEFAHYDDVQRWTCAESPIKGMVLRGKGRHFCAGANRENIFKLRDESEVQEAVRKCTSLFALLYGSTLPTVAAIEGVCWGGGLELALGCHVRICSKKALFSLPEVGEGIMPLFAVSLLPRLVGLFRALEMTLTTRMVDAEEALAMGIVDFVVPPKQTTEASLEFLTKVTRSRSVEVVRSTMEALGNGRDEPLAVAAERETTLAAALVFEQLKERGVAGEA